MTSLYSTLCVEYPPIELGKAAVRYAAAVTHLDNTDIYSAEWKRRDTSEYQTFKGSFAWG